MANVVATSEAIIQRLLDEKHITASEAMTLLKAISAPKDIPQYPPMQPHTPVYPNTPSIGKDENPFKMPQIYCDAKGTKYNPGTVTGGPGSDMSGIVDDMNTRID